MITGFRKYQHGVTLLETMLALGIAISLIVFGLRAYDQLRFQSKEQHIAANVNQLFLAMEGFYFSQCRQTLDANSNPQTLGKMDPLNTDKPTIPSMVSLSVGNDLVTPNLMGPWEPLNPLVDNSATDKGYFVQFNRVTTSSATDPVMSVYACTGSSRSPSCDRTDGAVLQQSSSNSTPTNQSHVVTWVAQVAVKLSDALTPKQWIQIKNDLNADCVSTSKSIANCTASPTKPTSAYLIWERMPSAYNPSTTSDYWTAMPYVKQFNMQYTNDGMAALSGVKNETENPVTKKNWYDPLYYLCGG